MVEGRAPHDGHNVYPLFANGCLFNHLLAISPTAANRMGTVVHQASRISNICGNIERFVRGDIWLAMDPCVNQASQTTEHIKPWATICSISDIPRWCPSGEQVVPMWCPGGAQVVPIATIITNFLLPVIKLRLWCVY